jgi:hypothetical protein
MKIRTSLSLIHSFSLYVNAYIVRSPMAHQWQAYHQGRFQPVMTISDDGQTLFPMPSPADTRKQVAKHTFFKGDPREFLG